jgi:hypothetical protein
MNTRIEGLSVRAQSWAGAQLVRAFCRRRGIEDARMQNFCEYIEQLATSTDVTAWDSRASQLEVAGLGDPLPLELERVQSLREIVENVHAISASQIYGAWVPEQAAAHLRAAAGIAGIDLHDRPLLQVLSGHDPQAHGWGDPIDADTLRRWRSAT